MVVEGRVNARLLCVHILKEAAAATAARTLPN